jgi:hypothetical protein
MVFNRVVCRRIAAGLGLRPKPYPALMPRRRLVLVALAVVALGAAWWLLSDGLSAEERRLVGTWRRRELPSGRLLPELIAFDRDRRFHFGEVGQPKDPDQLPSWWSIRVGMLVLDNEPSRFRRAVRPLAPYFGLDVEPPNRGGLEWVSGDELVYVDGAGRRVAWVRVREE